MRWHLKDSTSPPEPRLVFTPTALYSKAQATQRVPRQRTLGNDALKTFTPKVLYGSRRHFLYVLYNAFGVTVFYARELRVRCATLGFGI